MNQQQFDFIRTLPLQPRLLPIEPGSICSGTMRNQDLTRVMLEYLRERRPAVWVRVTTLDAPDKLQAALNYQGHPWWATEECWDYVDYTLWNAMDSIAPEGYYFGYHPGDGAGLGFWECE